MALRSSSVAAPWLVSAVGTALAPSLAAVWGGGSVPPASTTLTTNDVTASRNTHAAPAIASLAAASSTLRSPIPRLPSRARSGSGVAIRGSGGSAFAAPSPNTNTFATANVLQTARRAKSDSFGWLKGFGRKQQTAAPAPPSSSSSPSRAAATQAPAAEAPTHTATAFHHPLPYSQSYYTSHSLSPFAEGYFDKDSNYSNVSANVDVGTHNPSHTSGADGGKKLRLGEALRFEWWNPQPSYAATSSSGASSAAAASAAQAHPHAKEGFISSGQGFDIPTHADAGKNGVWSFPREIRD